MVNEFRNFMQRIEHNDSIDERKKKILLDYLKGNLFSNVRVFTAEEYAVIDKILEDFDYDVELFEKLLETTYRVRNAIGARSNIVSVPKVDYLYCMHTIFKELNMDLYGYDNSYNFSNIALARTVHKIIFDDGMLNKEISFIDCAREIYNRYCSGYSVNKSICKIFKFLNRIEKGFSELDKEYKNVVTSEEFYSMFERFREIDDLHFSDLIKDYYPIFENELFVLIKNAVSNASEDKIRTDYVVKYLDNIVLRRDQFRMQKEKAIQEVEKIEVATESNVLFTFSKLIQTIDNNNSISMNIRKDIISNIKNLYESKLGLQREFLNNEFDNFFSNCTSYINDLVIPSSSSNDGIDELIGVMVKNCKDFFVEYDSEKFKEIADYILANTDITVEQLKGVGEKCAAFFKEADINKLKVINNALKEFKTYVNKNFKDNEFADNIFEHILVNNPELLLNNGDKVNELLSFLKGEVTLKEYGYKYPDFYVNKDFLTYKFFNKIKENDYKFMLEASIPRLIHNLNYLEEKCEKLGINFLNFAFSEDMLYTLLSEEMYAKGSNTISEIKNLLDFNDFKKIIELNPDILMMKSIDLEIIVKRCLLNENIDYNFYDLVSSELYYYNFEEYSKSEEAYLMKKDFKYINLDINNSRPFDAEDIITDGYIVQDGLDKILKRYEERQEKIQKLNELLKELDKSDFDSFSLFRTVEEIFHLCIEVYGKVPCITYRNKVIDSLTDKKEKLEFELSDVIEELESKKESASIYENEKRDSDFAIEKIKEIINSIDSESVRKDLDKFLITFRSEHQVKSDKKNSGALEAIRDIESRMQILDRQVEGLSHMLSIMNDSSLDDSIEDIFDKSSSFTINELETYDYSDSKSEEDKIKELLDNKNLIIFADGVDLSEIPNDRNFTERIHKFLGDTDFSILSPSFMKNPSSEFVEKYYDHRDGIFSRREGRTPVRVYFIPVKNKYFNCYYVINVKYKDHNHYDGGCSNDDVYNRRKQEVKQLEKLISKMSYADLVQFIKEHKKNYEINMEHIVSKIESGNKKKNGKK